MGSMLVHPDRGIILIGYRCTGKTSIGKRLAAMAGLPFIDTDELVEAAEGRTIREMVVERGWGYFREREKEVIRTLTASTKSVIATGGGAVLDEENAGILKKLGILVWLTAGIDTICDRMEGDSATGDRRPSLSDGDRRREIAETLALRIPTYRRLADISIDTDALGIEGSVAAILSLLNGREGRQC